MLLENLSYPEVEQYLKEKHCILVPVGSVEQHSPYGLIGTDFIAAEHIARQAGEAMDILVAPTLNYGVSPHHMAFSGTVSLSPITFNALVCDVVRSLVTHGFKRIIFLNGHGGNIEPLKVALAQLKFENIQAIIQQISWYMLPGVNKISTELYQDKNGRHATASEVAVTMYNRPQVFKGKPTEPAIVENPNYKWPLSAEEFKKTFPDGRMHSAPWLATKAHGKQIVDVAVKALVAELSMLNQSTDGDNGKER
jgi:creatinine amidohydrolase